MGILADRMSTMTVTVRSPDGRVTARVDGEQKVRLRFKPGAYGEYAEVELEHQLSRLGTLLWTGYRRGYLTALTEAGGTAVQGVDGHWDANVRRYLEAQARLESRGKSPKGWVRAKSVSLKDWKVRIEPGALEQLDEAVFLSELHGLSEAVLRDFRGKIATLKAGYFDMQMPAPTRRRPRGATSPTR